MSKEDQRKFDGIMRRAGMEHLTKTTEERFKNLMEKEKMTNLNEELFYTVWMNDSESPGLKPYIFSKFKTKAERDKWYEEIGREIERVHGIKLEMPEKPELTGGNG